MAVITSSQFLKFVQSKDLVKVHIRQLVVQEETSSE